MKKKSFRLKVENSSKEYIKMSLKNILGLNDFPLNDSEIMAKIAEAKLNNINIIEFSNENKKVRINISKVASAGMMRGRYAYWES